ncbi:MAG TPA: MerR family transcriptional regulator [Campylobacterales bacterium]|nr:MerR family transcriptional regulator [Campylobacterales bacterium]HHS92222.1 MerR family transcriptional regulator [Campylobacterales bacterium]
MALKMKQLMEETGESKSTILFYVKEGLLPEPEKPKPNVHLYDESCINILKFIKYLQHELSYSIAQIQKVFEANNFNFTDDFGMIFKSLQLMNGSSDGKWYEEDDFLELSELEEEKLNHYKERGLLFKQEQGFSKKELDMVNLYKRAETLGLSKELFDGYVQSAENLAKLEYDLGAEMMEKEKSLNNEHYELLFDVILQLKPYLFNMHTIQEHQRRMEENHEKSL